MRMKFKSTTLSPRISVYKRFIGIEQSLTLKTVYLTSSDELYWTFDSTTLEFSEIAEDLIPDSSNIITINSSNVLAYQGTYFRYVDNAWTKTTDTTGLTLLSAEYNNIGKYQTNKYYFVGTIDCMQKGSLEESTTQYLKGNIMPLKSTNIKFFNDYVKVSPDDLLVWNKRLYSVERVEVDNKYQPKDYHIYFATINSIL